ncbi:MAG: hypothetical protein HYR51_03230 [Candidatus Rokubacteria bacterium]|nr:hypothetical protein [Candidatus Rokubacteria bacterium]
MAYGRPALLDDLADVLAEVRTWPQVVEKKPGVFYVRREPFLHVHWLRGDRRRGDVKGRNDWAQLDLPRPVTAARRRALMRELRARYREKEHTR